MRGEQVRALTVVVLFWFVVLTPAVVFLWWML